MNTSIPSFTRIGVLLFLLVFTLSSFVIAEEKPTEKPSLFRHFLDTPEEGWKFVQDRLMVGDEESLYSLGTLYALKFSKDPRYLFLKGTLETIRGKDSSATRYFDKSARLNKDSPYTKAAAAALKILHHDKDCSSAYNQLEELVVQHPEEPLIRLLFASLSYKATHDSELELIGRDKNEMIQNSIYHYRQCLLYWNKGDGGYNIQNDLALLLESRGSLEEELLHRQNAYRYSPTIYNGEDMADLLEKLEKNEEALKIIHEMIQKWPANFRSHSSLGLYNQRTGKIKEAIEAYNAALAHNNQSSRIWQNLGLLEEKLGHADKAENAYQKALENDSDKKLSRRRLRALYESRGAYDQAWSLELEKPIESKQKLSTDSFFRAIEQNRLLEVTSFLEKDPTLLEKRDANDSNQTPLMKAVQWGATRTALFLIEKGADPNALDKDSCNVTHYACQFNRLLLLEKFLEKEVDPWLLNRWKRSAGFHAISYRRPEAIPLLLKKYPLAVSKNNYIPIFLAAAGWQEMDILRDLHEKGIAVDQPLPETGETALMRAARWERRESLFFLLSKGANANAIDRESKNALHYLFDDPKETPNIEFYQWLVKNGADVNHPNAKGKTPAQLLNQSIAKKFLMKNPVVP